MAHILGSILDERTFQEAYTLGPHLGSGSFGHVFTCQDKKTQKEYACKMIPKSSIRSVEAWSNVQRETALLATLRRRHDHVVQLREVVDSRCAVHVITELCRGGDLFELLQRRGRLPEASAKLLFAQLSSALAFCHSLGVAHRDLKPENILLDRPADDLYRLTSAADVARASPIRAKLADFGLATVVPPGGRLSGYVGSLRYKSPEEVGGGKLYGLSADVWSLGVVLYAMLSGCLPFSGRTVDDNVGLRRAILSGAVKFAHPSWADVSASAKDLVAGMLQLNPDKRPSAKDVLNHPWVRGVLGAEVSEDVEPAMSPSSARSSAPTSPSFSAATSSSDSGFSSRAMSAATSPTMSPPRDQLFGLCLPEQGPAPLVERDSSMFQCFSPISCW